MFSKLLSRFYIFLPALFMIFFSSLVHAGQNVRISFKNMSRGCIDGVCGYYKCGGTADRKCGADGSIRNAVCFGTHSNCGDTVTIYDIPCGCYKLCIRACYAGQNDENLYINWRGWWELAIPDPGTKAWSIACSEGFTICDGEIEGIGSNTVSLEADCIGLVPIEYCDDGKSCTSDGCCQNWGNCVSHTYPPCPPDGWYDTGEIRWITDPNNECQEIKQKKQEYRDYYYDSNGCCQYNVTGYRWVDTEDIRPKPDGTPCTLDSNECTDDYCISGQCKHPSKPDGTPCTLDSNECTDDYCISGQCKHPSKPDGTSCNDTQYCTVDDKCMNGNCVGNPRDCRETPDIKCTVDSCNEEKDQCIHTPKDELCNDGIFCNGNEVCDPKEGCKDNVDPCMEDSCKCTVTCVEESDKCNVPEPTLCNDNNICTEDICDLKLCCVYKPIDLPPIPCYPCKSGTPGIGICKEGVQYCKNGQLQPCEGYVCPTQEVCDGKDNNCDGLVDEDLGTTTCGVGECQVTVENCVNGIPQKCIPKNPQDEVCDGKDNDCDGIVDDGLGRTTCGVGECQVTVENCVNGIPQKCIPKNPTPEICDGKDNDCDGKIDEISICDCPAECDPRGIQYIMVLGDTNYTIDSLCDGIPFVIYDDIEEEGCIPPDGQFSAETLLNWNLYPNLVYADQLIGLDELFGKLGKKGVPEPKTPSDPLRYDDSIIAFSFIYCPLPEEAKIDFVHLTLEIQTSSTTDGNGKPTEIICLDGICFGIPADEDFGGMPDPITYKFFTPPNWNNNGKPGKLNINFNNITEPNTGELFELVKDGRLDIAIADDTSVSEVELRIKYSCLKRRIK